MADVGGQSYLLALHQDLTRTDALAGDTQEDKELTGGDDLLGIKSLRSLYNVTQDPVFLSVNYFKGLKCKTDLWR